jgi:hypothetical protein
VEGFITAPNVGATAGQATLGALTNVSQPNPGANLNLQHPFYHTMAFGPIAPPMGSGVPHGPILDVLSPRTSVPNTASTGNNINEEG